MPEEQPDMMDQMQKMGEKWTEFKKTWVAHFKEFDFEVREWNFGAGKTGEEYIIDLKAKVVVKPKQK